MRSEYIRRSDADLIKSHIAGDLVAWEHLLERYERFIYKLILRANVSSLDADDIFQNVCIKFYMHLDDLREVSRITGWLAAVISQEILRWRRRVLSRTPSVSLDSPLLADSPREEPLPEDIVIAEEKIRFVQQALHNSGEPCLGLLSLLYGPDPVPYAQVAEQLDIPVGSIGPRRARCLERIKKLLAHAGY